jgi:hypothetical protein
MKTYAIVYMALALGFIVGWVTCALLIGGEEGG